MEKNNTEDYDHPPSLSFLFDTTQQLFTSLENSPLNSSDPAYQKDVRRALANFEVTATVVSRSDIFSSNEELDDIHTSTLKYLLLNYYIGLLNLKLVDENRLRNLQNAQACLNGFLQQCENLSLIQKDDLKAFHRESNQLDAKMRREEKIARFKRDKLANARIEELLKVKVNQNKKASSGYIKKEEEEVEEEEDVRELRLLQIEIATRKALEELEMSMQEAEMLKQMEEMKLKNGGKPIEIKKEPPKVPFKNFVLLPSKREKMKKEVFLPRNLPTMTVEEWFDLQVENGTLNTASPSTNSKKKDDDEYDEEEEEKKRQKAISFDNFKDEHPKGEGNKNDHYYKRG